MPGYLYFFLAVALLIGGYFLYGKFVEWVYQPNLNKITPAIEKADGVDFVQLPTWKVFLIQLLNIAGLGPVFGALSGALFGPAALIWIVVGCILGGAVHDFLSGMLSLRHNGENLPEILGRYLGKPASHILRFLCVSLCLLVGVVFVLGPAAILQNILPIHINIIIGAIFLYYFLATILPIQTLIGNLYPIFGIILIFMAGGVIIMLFAKGYTILPNTDFFTNVQPSGVPIWPGMFVTIACGAISGFHATQSPLMARCLIRKSHGRPVFFGSMVAEGVIALIWATVGLSLYPTSQELFAAMNNGNPAPVVNHACVTLLGPIGSVIAMIGVVILPITSGDTALRCARLMIADVFHISQTKLGKRLGIAVPMFAICFILTQVDYQIVWRYFGWMNQIIATMTLWAISGALVKYGKTHWISTIPALFMTSMCLTYFFSDKLFFHLPVSISTYLSIGITVTLLILFLLKQKRKVV